MAGYIVAHVDVQDPEAYKQYTSRTPQLVEKYGGRFMIRGAPPEVLEGDWSVPRLVVLQFDSVAAARRFYESDDYQEILPLRRAASVGTLALFPGPEEMD